MSDPYRDGKPAVWRGPDDAIVVLSEVAAAYPMGESCMYVDMKSGVTIKWFWGESGKKTRDDRMKSLADALVQYHWGPA